MTTQSQNKRILDHLQSGRTLTPLEALNIFGCMRLGGRINDLRKQGHPIQTEIIKLNGKRVAKYSL